MVVPPPLILGDTVGGVVSLPTVLQQPSQSQVPSQVYASYAVGPYMVSFFFRVKPSTSLLMLVSVMVSVFYFKVPVWLSDSPVGGSTVGVCIMQSFVVYLWQAYVAPDGGPLPCQECTKRLLPPLL